MQNLFAEISQIWNYHKKKKRKKVKDFESASPLAKSIKDILGKFLNFVSDSFPAEQKTNLLKVIGTEFVKFLEDKLPQEKYSQNELIKLSIDMEEYDELIRFINQEKVTQKQNQLKALVNLLKVPWDHLDSYLEENDIYKEVEKESLDQFIRCIRRMNKK